MSLVLHLLDFMYFEAIFIFVSVILSTRRAGIISDPYGKYRNSNFDLQ